MPRSLVKTVSWLPSRPLALEEGPITESNVYSHGTWWRWNDTSKLRALRELSTEYGRDPRMRWFTVNTVLRPSGVNDFRNYDRTAAALLGWVQRNIYYTNEPGEQIQAPWWTIKYRTGDCDDMAVLLASMAESVRIPWRFALAGKDPKGRPVRYIEGGDKPPHGSQFFHIYLYLGWPPFKPTTWVAAEPTVKVPLGHDVVEEQAAKGPGAAPLPELAGMQAGTDVYGRPLINFDSPEQKRTLVREVAIGVAIGTLQAVLTALILKRVMRRK